jgi:hypothetical protein
MKCFGWFSIVLLTTGLFTSTGTIVGFVTVAQPEIIRYDKLIENKGMMFFISLLLFDYPNLPLIPQTKNPATAGLLLKSFGWGLRFKCLLNS